MTCSGSIGDLTAHQEEEQAEQPGRGGERNQTDRLRVEEGDDEHGAQIVGNGQRGEEDLQAERHP